MSIREAKYYPGSKQTVYPNPPHHGELIKGSNVKNDAPSAVGQNLAGAEGLNLADRLFANRKKS